MDMENSEDNTTKAEIDRTCKKWKPVLESKNNGKVMLMDGQESGAKIIESNVAEVTGVMKKWKPLLNVQSSMVDPVKPEDMGRVADLLEKYEKLFLKYDAIIIKIIILVRTHQSDLNYSFDMINGDICIVIDDVYKFQTRTKSKIALPIIREQNIHTFCVGYVDMYYLYDKDKDEWTEETTPRG